MTYLNAKKYLAGAPEHADESRLAELLLLLGNPQKRLKFLRLAGSNGKTVCGQMLAEVLAKTQHQVGFLRMPVGDEPRENILINNKPISFSDFARLVDTVKHTLIESDLTPTSAEIFLAVALLAFKESNCALTIIESKHHGNDPSINLPSPFAAIICGTLPDNDEAEISRIRTFVSRDIEEIISAPQNPHAYKAISDICYSANCRLTLPSRNALTVDRSTFMGADFSYKSEKYRLNVCGVFQVSNALLAIEGLEMLSRKGFAVDTAAIREGLSRLRLAAKFEVLSVSPLIIVDSAHSSAAIPTTCDALVELGSNSIKGISLCLPSSDLIAEYSTALTVRGFEIAETYTSDTNCDGAYVFKTPKSFVKQALPSLDKSSTLLISGDSSFVLPIRHELLNTLGIL
ncbi:MAG: hypothetical protein E7677_01745 [Ruminococcaceae bacterium]|nr:hypothetical protein [Oscillospiraceae bacterium]